MNKEEDLYFVCMRFCESFFRVLTIEKKIEYNKSFNYEEYPWHERELAMAKDRLQHDFNNLKLLINDINDNGD